MEIHQNKTPKSSITDDSNLNIENIRPFSNSISRKKKN